MLIQIIHHINVRAEHKVDKELIHSLRKVKEKNNLLFQMTEQALHNPDGIIRDVLYPIVSKETLKDLVKGFKHTGPAYKQTEGLYHYSFIIQFLLPQNGSSYFGYVRVLFK